MKIFITGGTGFIGRNLIDFYCDEEIFQYKRGSDLADDLKYFKPDLIINSAAEIYKSELMWEPNVLMVVECLKYVRSNPNTKMIQIGSSAEYGPMPRASNEQDRINPVDIYQATKGAATLLCQGYARNYGLNIKIARPYSVYGKFERPHRLFPRLWRAFRLDQGMKLYQGYHDFIYINDFVRGIDYIVRNDSTPAGDIINFGSGVQYSNFEVLELWEKIFGYSAQVDVITTMAKSYESEVWVCDTSYARQKYDFEIKYDLEQGIKDFIEVADYHEENV